VTTTILRMAGILLSSCLSAVFALPARAQNFSDVRPSPQQVEWQDLEIGALIHFGTNSFLDREWGDGKADPKVFNPAQLDVDQWMRAIQAAGGKYVILVAKHHDGFCLWPSEQTDYSVKNSPWSKEKMNGKGDIVRLASDAAKKHGLKFGIYVSPWDRHEPRYADSKEYDKYYAAQLDELASNYGDLVEFWLDGAGSAGHVYNFPKIIEQLRMWQPNTLVFADTALFEYGDIRWVGNEDGTVPFENWNVVDRHGYLRWRPAEADTPLREKHWFWHPNDEASLKSLDKLVTIYHETVGRGAQLVLGLAPDNRGLLPEVDVKRLEEFGAAIRQRYSNNLVPKFHILASTASAKNEKAALDGDADTFWSAPAGSHHAMLEVNFAKPVTFDHALLMERLSNGQHIQKFRIEVWDGKQWKPLAAGSAIGHKRIAAFPAVTASRIRLNILSSTAEAEIREFQLFSLSSPQ